MGRFTDRFVVIALFATFGVVGMLMSARHVTATTPPPAGPSVSLIGPLPLPVTGTVAVTNAPTSMTVSNPATNPVLIRDVDRLAKSRFQTIGGCSMDDLVGTCDAITYAVPANKLLVIETVSVQLNVQPGRKPFAAIVTYQDGHYSRYFLPVQPESTFNGFDFYTGLHLVRLYADPGTTVTVFGSRDSGGGQNGAEASISGYLMDCVAGPCALP